MTSFTQLFEKDAQKTLLKLGLSPEATAWCIERGGDKYAQWVATVTFISSYKDNMSDWGLIAKEQIAADPKGHFSKWTKEATESGSMEAVWSRTRGNRNLTMLDALCRTQDKPKLPKSPNLLSFDEIRSYTNDLQYIKDWAHNPLATDRVPLQTMAWDDALRKSHEFHAAMHAMAKDKEQELAIDADKIILKFPDGWYWADLDCTQSDEEADAMGHCGRATTGTLYSLRNPRGVPHITADLNKKDSVAGQIYGKGNTKPKSTYHRKILELLGQLGIERIFPATHGEGSLSVDDIGSEDLEWFEETYGHELIGSGITDAEEKAVKAAVQEANQGLEWFQVSSSLDYGSESDDYFELEWYLTFDLSSYDVTDKHIPYAVQRDIGNVLDLPSDINDIDIEREGELRMSGRISGYDTKARSGEGDYSSSDPDDWAAKELKGMAYYDNKVADSFSDLLNVLVTHGVISRSNSEAYDNFVEAVEDSEFEISHVRGGNFKVSRPLIPGYFLNGRDDRYGPAESVVARLNSQRVADYWISTVGGTPARQLIFTDMDPDMDMEDLDALFLLEADGLGNLMLSSAKIGGGEAAKMRRVLQGMGVAEEHWHRLVEYVKQALGADGRDPEPALDRARKFTELFKDRS